MCDRCEELELLIAEMKTPPFAVSHELIAHKCHLSPQRLRLFGRLTQKLGTVVSYQALNATLWGMEDGPEDISNALKAQICYLRRQLRKHGVPIGIYTKWGHGYYAERVR